MEHTDVLNFVKGMRVCRFDSYRGTDQATDFARLSYGDLKPLDNHQTPEPTDFLTPEQLSGSDYCSSGSVEVSNHRVFLEQFKDSPNVYDVYGGYGTFAVAIRLDSITDEMVEVLNALEDYPVIDEEDLSEVEHESEEESWSNCYRSDFERALSREFPDLEETIDDMTTEQVDALFYEVQDRTNTYWAHETGNNAYIDVDRVVAGVTEEDIVKFSTEL